MTEHFSQPNLTSELKKVEFYGQWYDIFNPLIHTKLKPKYKIGNKIGYLNVIDIIVIDSEIRYIVTSGQEPVYYKNHVQGVGHSVLSVKEAESLKPSILTEKQLNDIPRN